MALLSNSGGAPLVPKAGERLVKLRIIREGRKPMVVRAAVSKSKRKA